MCKQWRLGRLLAAASFISILVLIHFSWTHSVTRPFRPTDNTTRGHLDVFKSFQQHGHDTASESQALDAEQHSIPSGTPETTQLSTPALEATRPQCALTKVSMLYGSHRFSQLEAALASHRGHSERWGCGFESLDYDISSRKLYSKHYFLLLVLLRELAKPETERQEWLMWVDADSILINPALSPELFLPPTHLDHIFALVTADHNGLNNGVFYLRVHTSTLDLLTQTVAYPLAHPEEDLGWFGEQAAMANVIKSIETLSEATSQRSGIVWVPRTWFNTYQFETGFEGGHGNMLVHFAGLAETRISHMANWLRELEEHSERWEIPLEDSIYNTSVAEFWNKYESELT